MNIHKKITSFWHNLIKPNNQTDPIVNVDCTEFEVDNWLISKFILEKIIPIVGIKPYPLDELTLMVASVCRLQPSYIFEWGTHVGKSARIFYETCAYFNIKTVIHSIDLPDSVNHIEHPKNERGRLVKGFEQVVLHQGDGLNKALEICKKEAIKDRVIFFLDGDHQYKSVKRELMGIMKHIPKANILIHDTFYQSSKSGYNIGPFKAIQNVLMLFPNNYEIFATKIGLPGMTFLFKLKTAVMI